MALLLSRTPHGVIDVLLLILSFLVATTCTRFLELKVHFSLIHFDETKTYFCQNFFSPWRQWRDASCRKQADPMTIRLYGTNWEATM